MHMTKTNLTKAKDPDSLMLAQGGHILHPTYPERKRSSRNHSNEKPSQRHINNMYKHIQPLVHKINIPRNEKSHIQTDICVSIYLVMLIGQSKSNMRYNTRFARHFVCLCTRRHRCMSWMDSGLRILPRKMNDFFFCDSHV